MVLYNVNPFKKNESCAKKGIKTNVVVTKNKYL